MNRFNQIICFLFAIAAIVLVVVKATTCAFTHDEAYTVLHYMDMKTMNILAFDIPYTNNHMLNTVFMKWSTTLFGESDLTMRLPNIVFFVFYLIAGFIIVKQLNNPWLVIPGFVLLIANPFLMDFFSLARGYGMAISLMIISIAFYSRFLKIGKDIWFLGALIFAGMSVQANFTSFYFLFALMGLHFIIGCIQYKKIAEPSVGFVRFTFRYNRMTLFFIPVYTLIMYEAVRRLLGQKIDFGGMKGIWEDTVYSLVFYTNYMHLNSWMIPFLQIFLVVFLIFAAFGGLVFIMSKHKPITQSTRLRFLLQGFFFLVLLESFLHHIVSGTPYLSDRMALFLIPLFWLNVVFLLDQVRFKWVAVFPFLLSIIFCIHFSQTYTTDYVIFWSRDKDVKKVVELIQSEVKDQPARMVKLGITWQFEPNLNYYRRIKKLTWLQELDRKGLSDEDDYRYIISEEKNLVSDTTKFELIEDFPFTKTALYRAKK